jgi:hypothetical protein
MKCLVENYSSCCYMRETTQSSLLREHQYDSIAAQQITSHHTLAPYNHATASREESDSSTAPTTERSPLCSLSCLSPVLPCLRSPVHSRHTFHLHIAALAIRDIKIAVLHTSEHTGDPSTVYHADTNTNRHRHRHRHRHRPSTLICCTRRTAWSPPTTPQVPQNPNLISSPPSRECVN